VITSCKHQSAMVIKKIEHFQHKKRTKITQNTVQTLCILFKHGVNTAQIQCKHCALHSSTV